MSILKPKKSDILLFVIAIFLAFTIPGNTFSEANTDTDAKLYAALLSFVLSIIIYMLIGRLILWIINKVRSK